MGSDVGVRRVVGGELSVSGTGSGVVSWASRIFRTRGDYEKTEAKYTVWLDKTSFRFSWRNL